METISREAERAGRALGSTYEGGAESMLDLLLSPLGLLAIGILFLVLVIMGRR